MVLLRSMLALLLLMMAFLIKAIAQEDDSLTSLKNATLPVVVVTATRIPTNIYQVNRTVEVIPISTMDIPGAISIEDILRFSSSVDAQPRGILGVQADLGIRGGLFSQNLILLNGLRMNDPQTAHHNLDIPVSLFQIERIEIVKGHGSAQYGPDAFGGTMNIITKQPQTNSVTLSLGGGEHDLGWGVAGFDIVSDKFYSSNVIEMRKSSGYRYDTEFTIWNMSTSDKIEDSHGVYSFVGGYTNKKFGAFDFYSPGRDVPSKENTSVGYVSAAADLKSGGIALQPKVFYRRHDDKFIFDLRTPDKFVNTHTTHVLGGEISGTMSMAESIILLSGIDVNIDRISSTRLGEHRRSNAGVFVSLQTSVNDIVTLDVSGREDFHSKYGNQFDPAIGIGFLFSEQGKVFASVGRSFRAPSYTELYYSDPANIGNSDLKPETGWSYEIGMRYALNASFSFKSNIFQRDQFNLIDYVQFYTGDRYHAVNFTRARTRGGEIGAQWNISVSSLAKNRIELRTASLQYTYLESTIDRGASVRSKYSMTHPKHQITGIVRIDVPYSIQSFLSAVYKYRTRGNSYTLVDVNLSHKYDAISVFMRVANVLDTSYEEIASISLPGRWIWGGIQVEVL